MVSSLLKGGHVPCSDMFMLGSRVILGRWFMIFASLLIMSVAGAAYMFGLYSNDIKSAMGYDQSTLNLLSFSKDLGGNVGVLSGLINEVTPPWVVLSLGAGMNFFGYLMIWLAVTHHLTNVPIWQMCLYICIGANSQTFANTGALVTCVKNFPQSRGVVLGLLKGFVGLSGAILTQLFYAFYGKDSSKKSLILFIAWLPAAVSIVFLRIVRVLKVVRVHNELSVFYNLLYISLSLAGFLLALIIVQNEFNFTRGEYYASAFFVIFLLFLPLAIVVKEERNRDDRNLNPGSDFEVVTETYVAQGVVSSERLNGQEGEDSWVSNVFKSPNRGDDYTILQALFSIDMWILFIATTCGVGGALTAIDNLGQIGTSLGYPTHSISTFVSLVSIWNYLGRVISGFASEIVLVKYKFPRPMMLTLVLLISCVGHLLIAFAVPKSLYVASIIIGFCFGAQWPLIFAIISEIFGLKYYSTLYNFGAAASPVGSYILNVVVTGKLYDREALKQLSSKGLNRKEGDDLTCFGPECYKLSFLIISGVTVFGCLVSFILVLRTSKFYRGDIYKKFREASKVPENEMGTYVGNGDGIVTTTNGK